jgi:hypothetical protein
MADLDTLPRPLPQPSHDGTASCRLCIDAVPAADRDWCRAAGCLLCDECCRRLVHGDGSRLAQILLESGEPMTLESLYIACASCERGRHRFAEHLLDVLVSEGPPC